jgi:hypothetical protein
MPGPKTVGGPPAAASRVRPRRATFHPLQRHPGAGSMSAETADKAGIRWGQPPGLRVPRRLAHLGHRALARSPTWQSAFAPDLVPSYHPGP